MRITLDCPRCKQPLAVPTRRVGTYVNCPRCNGRFWVPDGAGDAGKSSVVVPEGDLNSSAIVPLGKAPVATPPGMSPPASGPSLAVSPEVAPGPLPPGVAMAVPPPPPLPATAPLPPGPLPPVSPPAPSGGAAAANKLTLNPAGGVTKFDWTPPAGARPSGAAPPSPPAMPPPSVAPAKHVARFVAAEAASSGVRLAEDGKLPELQLQEGQQERNQKKPSGMNPLALAALLCLSVGASIAMVVFGTGQQGSLNSEEQLAAWREIEAKYFSNLDPKAALEPYQVCLREARQAASRGERRTATDRLRRVLAMLRTERGGLEEKQRRYEGTKWGSERTLTGSPDRDAKLEEYVTVLLRQ